MEPPGLQVAGLLGQANITRRLTLTTRLYSTARKALAMLFYITLAGATTIWLPKQLFSRRIALLLAALH
eukprot:scaffold15987_cov69-Cylindrotheca_fusiformis.AAC.1